MTSLQNLIGMRILWAGEEIEWKVPNNDRSVITVIENWIKRWVAKHGARNEAR